MATKETESQKQLLQDKIKKMQAKLRTIEAAERKAEEKRLSKIREEFFKILAELELYDVKPEKLRELLKDNKAKLLADEKNAES
ncbi:hypothetical protein H8K32_19670 [Undibacterium jejuense]|uniref:Uncharacterized protein n=1 Tax=Undibacterium jejuense TaxID=1344949 RepID=A0A923HIG3_9BURK|nr:hypothetical protein [Undibacterium jejuense]MBC3864324.1 hypothetical protein [Undibacterium jejuense]